VSFVVGKGPHALDHVAPIYVLLMVVSFFLVFGIFNYAEANPSRNWHGFPYRLFWLPVSTWVLVAVPMLLGSVSVGLVYLAWAKLVFALAGRQIVLWPGIVLCVGLPCFQALIWSLAGFRITRLIVLGLAGLLFVDIAILPEFPEQLPWRINGTLVMTCLAGTAFLGAWFSVERQRRGGGRGQPWFRTIAAKMVDCLPRRRSSFASPAAAQFWFEWRRGGLVLPFCTGAAILLVFVPASLLTRHDPGATLWTLGWALALPIILGAAVGKGFSRPDFWSGEMAIPAFLATRPIASGDMIVTKMKVAVLSVSSAWLAVCVFLVIWLPGWANFTQLRELWELLGILRTKTGAYLIAPLFLFAGALLTWRAMIGNLWVGLSGDKRRFAVSILFQFTAVIFGLWLFTYLKNTDWKQISHLDRIISGVGLALAVAVIVRLWLSVFSWKHIRSNRVFRYALLWAFSTSCIAALGMLLCPKIFWLKHLCILAALLAVPLARLGLAPLSLGRNRHR
jgi:hypothetical protein